MKTAVPFLARHVLSAIAFLVICVTCSPCKVYSQWVPQNSGTSAGLNTVVTLDLTTAITAGDSGIILRTSNSGVTWVRTAVGGYRWSAIAFRTPQRGTVVGQQGSIANTTDGGITWAYWNTGSARSLTAVTYAGISDLYVGDDSGGVMYSHDDGITWSTMQLPLHGTIQDICVEPGDFIPYWGYAIMDMVAYACGSGGAIFKTIDGGNFWGIGFGPTSKTLHAIDFYNEVLGFAVGDSGTILFTSNGGVTSAGEVGSLLAGFLHSQNYPNPFNPSTTFSFNIPYSSFIILRVYDLLGREVATLVNEEMEPGRYGVTWNATGFPSGVYIYRLEAGRFVEVKRMVLVR